MNKNYNYVQNHLELKFLDLKKYKTYRITNNEITV
jgi:hypothetical protein